MIKKEWLHSRSSNVKKMVYVRYFRSGAEFKGEEVLKRTPDIQTVGL
jgi:hypothetical protein